MAKNKTGGGLGTNQHGLKPRTATQPTAQQMSRFAGATPPERDADPIFSHPDVIAYAQAAEQEGWRPVAVDGEYDGEPAIVYVRDGEEITALVADMGDYSEMYRKVDPSFRDPGRPYTAGGEPAPLDVDADVDDALRELAYAVRERRASDAAPTRERLAAEYVQAAVASGLTGERLEEVTTAMSAFRQACPGWQIDAIDNSGEHDPVALHLRSPEGSGYTVSFDGTESEVTSGDGELTELPLDSDDAHSAALDLRHTFAGFHHTFGSVGLDALSQHLGIRGQ